MYSWTGLTSSPTPYFGTGTPEEETPSRDSPRVFRNVENAFLLLGPHLFNENLSVSLLDLKIKLTVKMIITLLSVQ